MARNQSKLADHKKRGKKLVPPLADLPNVFPASWVDDRLPDILWIALVLHSFPRQEAITRIQKIFVAIRDIPGILEPIGKRPTTLEITHSGMSQLDMPICTKLIGAVLYDEPMKEALRPILVLDSLPCLTIWKKQIGKKPLKSSWNSLSGAIRDCYLHYEQGATDCRWAKVGFSGISGRSIYVQGTEHLIDQIIDYPTLVGEDLRKAGPAMRAAEIMLEGDKEWAHAFWTESFDKTGCLFVPPSEEAISERKQSQVQSRELADRLVQLNESLIDHYYATLSTSGFDPRHEVSFGIALYATTAVMTAAFHRLEYSPQGRMTLRTLCESLITLKSLIDRDEFALWATFRKHGEGQAKLVLQKSEESGRCPKYLDKMSLDQIANEDIWVEFLPINLGQWESSNLRQLAIDTGLKDIYDDYYTWTSSYSHGIWGAIRETSYDLCVNPLHRFHRIPHSLPNHMNSCRDDMYALHEKILDLLHQIYPRSSSMVS